MRNRSRSSRAAMAAMVVALMAVAAMSAEAGLRRIEGDPAGGGGPVLRRQPLVEVNRFLSGARRAATGAMIRLWETFDVPVAGPGAGRARRER